MRPGNEGARTTESGKIMNVAGKVLAVSGDGFARMYGQGERGAGHAVFIPTGSQGDPLGGSGARITRACGSTLPTEKAAEKFQGDKRCPKCVEWLATQDGTAALESARAERHAWEFGADDMAELFSVAEIDGTDTREDSAPVDPPAAPESDAVGITGLTHAEMREATERFYANGGKPSAEILALPAPGTGNRASGTVSGSAAEILVCTFKGEVSTVNPERTHGKCPDCTTYIPLLPGDAGSKESGPKVSKIKCEGTGKAPAPGTRVMRDDHTVSVADDYDGKHSGKCPEGARVIAVSREGGMRKHNGVDAREFKGGADTGATVAKGARLALSRGHGSVDGSATTGSQSMAPVQPKGWVGVAGTGSLPAMVRPGIDPEGTGVEGAAGGDRREIAHRGRSRGWRRRPSTVVGTILRERKAKRDADRAAKIERGEMARTAARKAGRKAAATAS